MLLFLEKIKLKSNPNSWLEQKSKTAVRGALVPHEETETSWRLQGGYTAYLSNYYLKLECRYFRHWRVKCFYWQSTVLHIIIILVVPCVPSILSECMEKGASSGNWMQLFNSDILIHYGPTFNAIKGCMNIEVCDRLT